MVTPQCSAGDFRCVKSKECIPRSFFCDGKADCSDESDEENYNSEKILSLNIFKEESSFSGNYFTIHNNGLKYIDNFGFFYRDVKLVDLSYNDIEVIRSKDFKRSYYLQEIRLQSNRVRNIEDNALKDQISLCLLDLSNNSLSYVNQHMFRSLTRLNYLFLNSNKISFIHKKAFFNLKKLYTLDLSNNDITHFGDELFLNLENLENLFIQNNDIISVKDMFLGLFNLKLLKVDVFSICCAKPRSVFEVQCVAPRNEISSCENLISVPILNIVLWYIALFATFGNIIAFLYSITKFKKRFSFAYFVFCRNLNIADLLMGIYLYIIATVNLIYTGSYGFQDHEWRHSFLCTFAGIIATVSSEASALFVSLITIDRVVAIRHPLHQRNMAWIVASSFLSWSTAIFVSVLPIMPFQLSMFKDFYAQSPICISLPLSVYRQNGWQYAMIIFIGFNFFIFSVITVGQFVILFEAVKSGRNSNASNMRRREISLAKTVVAVVLTDLFCWIPIGIIGMLTFYGIDISSEVYAWIVVLVLPINSALNPILYTLSAILRDRGRRMRIHISPRYMI
ncbi:G-protein coupled receptor GRL101-like [Saccostrea cucullata]|uniref:G-protein coupled receptor GRL101-like n=1 Tax=Saccostrea cuccullata TaxID=36930 RepID=UPI002ED58D29